ncbi:START domain-containing protein [Heracleum sosnowskyi]|uniref:START domain-containing protein n=1 Tax=Heracleum sosnowskyi TaxID=360622 RepID=A0AAD8I689_9APIA|nr:START domain-containing protein [Heracleum sosnowskyi]
MEDFFFDLLEFVKKPALIETFVDILLCSVPIWLAVVIGLLIGWSWRPRWTGLVFLGLRPKLRFVWTFPPGFGARRLWLACTALSAFSVASRLWSNFRLSRRKSSGVEKVESGSDLGELSEAAGGEIRLINGTSTKEHVLVTKNDLEHLLHLLDGKGWDRPWQYLMDRSTSNMAYQAWHHEPETGVIYKSRTVFEDATPELVRDFFWDDEFRPKWDPMLGYFKMLNECPQTGTSIVHWIKKFPFFCSDREYIIGRRIWEAGNTYYCVTKAVPYPALPKRDKPRRVDRYFSSWVIKPVQSRKGDGQLTACEVTLVHHEDMGIPKDVAKLGVRHGMWGTVKKLHGGFRAYQVARKSEAPLSRSAQLAKITTKISIDGSSNSQESVSGAEERNGTMDIKREGDRNGIDWKWLVVGGAVAMACGLHTGVIGKAVLFGAGQRIARGRRGASRR